MKPKHETLTAGFIRAILDYCPETGMLRWRARDTWPKSRNSLFAGKIAGTPVDGYVQIQIGGRPYYAHRIAWLHFHGVWPSHQIDHVNMDRADNRIANLRLATPSDNCCNKTKRPDNASGFPGVSLRNARNKWEARIMKDGKIMFRKTFDTAQEAHEARQAKLAEIHGEFAAH